MRYFENVKTRIRSREMKFFNRLNRKRIISKEITEEFPEKINIIHNSNKTDYIAIELVRGFYYEGSSNSKITLLISPTIHVAKNFYSLHAKNRKVGILHERGHYEQYYENRNKGTFIENLKMDLEWLAYEKRLVSGKECFSEIIKEPDFERLKKRVILKEMISDNYVIKSGFGHQLLQFLINTKGDYPNDPIYQEECGARITNLEEKLRSA